MSSILHFLFIVFCLKVISKCFSKFAVIIHKGNCGTAVHALQD